MIFSCFNYFHEMIRYWNVWNDLTMFSVCWVIKLYNSTFSEFFSKAPQPMYSILASNVVLYCTTCETITHQLFVKMTFCSTGSLNGKYFQWPYQWLTVVCSPSKWFFFFTVHQSKLIFLCDEQIAKPQLSAFH